MSSVPPIAQEAIELARRGDLDGALAAARKAIESHPDDYGLRLFVAMLHSRKLELDQALSHVEKAVALAPADPILRIERVRLLIGLDRLDEAEQQLAQVTMPGLEPHRLRAMIHARRDQHGEAAKIFREIVAADPRDHESWGNLGACLLANGQPQLALEPFARAVQLRPDIQKFREKWLQAQVEAGQGGAALVAARQLADSNPQDIAAQLAVARLEDLLKRPDQAVKILRELTAKHPNHLLGWIALAGLLERQNRIDELAEAIAQIEQLNPNAADLPLLRARLAYRQSDFGEALALAEAAPKALDCATRAELIGKIQDRLGNSAAAFRAFEQMNAASDYSTGTVAMRAKAVRDLIGDRARVTTAEWVRGWTPAPADAARREPAFIIGFPRSGTTLLDAFLMGHPDICVAEEIPLLQAVGEQLGDYERLASLDEAEVNALRDTYFAAAAAHAPVLGERMIVDKNPFGAIDAALIHRLFPTAKIVFSQRHPCDVVLSCFVTRFQPTAMLISFSTLEDTAKLYDKVMSLWEQFRAALPLHVHELKYEALVTDSEAELRQLVAFFGLEWDEAILRHQKASEGRSFIQTASYAQVIEPVYDRSVGRWKRYRDELEAVLPIITPWAVKMGYEI